MKTTRYLSFGPHYAFGTQTSFVPGETINCVPPYVAGKPDSLWLSGKMPNPFDKEACERKLGMKLQPLGLTAR